MLRLAVDVGGTFTDLVALDDEKGRLFTVKVRSTPTRPEQGFISALGAYLFGEAVDPSSISNVIHTGTIGSNLFLGQLGMGLPRTALLTTKGFRDVVEIGRQNRPELYNVFFQRPRPLVPRELRFEVSERVGPDGTVEEAVDPEELRAIAARLKGAGVEAVAVSYLNSYLNPENELVTCELISGALKIPVFASCQVDPEHREYERTSTTVVAAVLAPVLGRYLESSSRSMAGLGLRCPLHIFSSSGGLVDVGEVLRRPIVAIESGPAAGVVGAAELARMLDTPRVISLDMGGTTAKAACIVGYQPLLVPEVEVGGRVHMGRAVKGSGYPVRYPSIDVVEVGAGGGTIIWADEAGALNVGPVSAGAEPGPACYGAGGLEPTVTDANLVLGRLGEGLLGGAVRLKPELAMEALGRVGAKASMSAEEAAALAIRLANLQMARAIRLVSLERGLDPRMFTLLAFGGAGPMHAAELAEEVGISKVIVPPAPGLFSALGLLLTDMKFSYVRGCIRLLSGLDGGWLGERFGEMEAEALRLLEERGLDASRALSSTALDLRYYGQGYELEVPVSPPFEPGEIARSFEERHETVYGFRHEGEEVEVTALRLTLILPMRRPDLRSLAMGSKPGGAPLGERDAYFSGSWMRTPVYWRESLPRGASVEGPAVIEGYDSTVVVPPGWCCAGNELGCLVLERSGA